MRRSITTGKPVKENDLGPNWQPTAALRWAQTDGDGYRLQVPTATYLQYVVRYFKLQQAWENTKTGETVWRDVDVELDP